MTSRLKTLFTLANLILTAGLMSSNVSAQNLRIFMSVADASAPSGDTAAMLNVYIDNYRDTIAGFQFVLVSERPDLALFNFDPGTFDTTGTLVGGWEYVQIIDVAEDQSQIWFRCIANANPWDGHNTPGFPPQQSGVAVRLPFNTAPYPDTSLDLTSIISVTTPVDFSDPWGYAIGVLTDTIIDTLYFVCVQWESDSCIDWVEVDPDTIEYDLMYVDTSLDGYLDTNVVIIDGGSVSLLPRVICDWDDSGDVNVTDLSCIIEYLFGDYSASSCPYRFCDTDRSGGVDVGDLTYLVNFLFRGGPPPR